MMESAGLQHKQLKRYPTLTLKKLSAEEIAGKAVYKPVVEVQTTATLAVKCDELSASSQDQHHQQRSLSDYAVEPVGSGDKRSDSNTSSETESVNSPVFENFDPLWEPGQPDETEPPQSGGDNSERPRRKKRRESPTIRSSSESEGDIKEELEEQVKRLKKEYTYLREQYNALLNQYEGLRTLGSFYKTLNARIEAEKVRKREKAKKTEKTEKEQLIQDRNDLIEELTKCHRRLQDQEDQVSKCRFGAPLTQMDANSTDKQRHDEIIKILSGSISYDPSDRKDVEVQTTSIDNSEGFGLPQKLYKELSHENKEVQTDQSGEPETAPASSSKALDAVTYWENIQKNTTIHGQPWFDAISKLILDKEGGLKIMGKFSSQTLWAYKEITLLQHVAYLVRRHSNTTFASFQAIPLKMAIHLLQAKGMKNQEIAMAFSEIDNNRFWTEGLVSKVETTRIDNQRLGSLCSPPQVSQDQWVATFSSDGTTCLQLVE